MSTRLGELLVKRGLISVRAARKRDRASRERGARSAQHRAGRRCAIFSDAGAHRPPAEGVPPAAGRSGGDGRPAEVVRLVPPTLARRHHLVPISLTGSTLTLAHVRSVEPGRDQRGQVPHRLRRARSRSPRTSSVSARDRAVSTTRAPTTTTCSRRSRTRTSSWSRTRRRSTLKELERATEDAPVVRLVNAILTSAIKRRASDIHLEPFEKMFRVRYRVDGVLERDHEAAAQAQERHHLAHQDHGGARHRRAPPAAGRPHQAQARPGPEMDFRVSRAADDLRREDRAAPARQGRTCSST